MKKVSTPKQIDKKLLQKLDIFVNELKQDFVLVGSDTDKDVQIIESYHTQLHSSHIMIYIDFKKVSNMQELAEAILDECYKVFGRHIDEELHELLSYWREEEDYRFLDKILEVPQTMAEKLQTTIIFWNENFTEVLSLQDASLVCNMMRGAFQMQQDVLHIFTSQDICLLNRSLTGRREPFFRFARIVKLSEE